MMLSLQKWKCSGPLLAAIASFIVLVSVIHVFLYPLVPSFDSFGSQQVRSSCYPLNNSNFESQKVDQYSYSLDAPFVPTTHGAVNYRGAPWKPEIGRWFLGCDSIAKTINITEVLIVLLTLFSI